MSAEEYRLANETAQRRLAGEEPMPVAEVKPPPLLIDYDAGADAALRCPFCDSTALQIVQLFLSNETGEYGSLIGCTGCRRGFGVTVIEDEDRVRIGVRAVGEV